MLTRRVKVGDRIVISLGHETATVHVLEDDKLGFSAPPNVRIVHHPQLPNPAATDSPRLKGLDTAGPPRQR
jgi:hypothetical protein